MPIPFSGPPWHPDDLSSTYQLWRVDRRPEGGSLPKMPAGISTKPCRGPLSEILVGNLRSLITMHMCGAAAHYVPTLFRFRRCSPIPRSVVMHPFAGLLILQRRNQVAWYCHQPPDDCSADRVTTYSTDSRLPAAKLPKGRRKSLHSIPAVQRPRIRPPESVPGGSCGGNADRIYDSSVPSRLRTSVFRMPAAPPRLSSIWNLP